MSLSLADYYGVDELVFEATGALDPILDVDTRLFIDPALLRIAETPELLTSAGAVEAHFTDVLNVVNAVEVKGDRMWREADRLLTFPEIAGLSIGYSASGTGGSGMGAALRAQLLASVLDIVRAGGANPALFEIVGIFEEGVGPDRISDMIAKIISRDLISFTQRVCSDCGIPMAPHRLRQLRLEEDLPTHPYTGAPMILVPKEILRDLPVAEGLADVRWIAQQNEDLREKMNALIGSAWREVTVTEQKQKLRRTFIQEPELLKDLIRAYQSEAPERYDFENDPAGEVLWYKTSKRLPAKVPLKLALSEVPTLDEVEGVVLQIVDHFKVLVEDNQLARLLYDGRGKPKHESASQLLFFGVASAYCKANNLDLSPESDCGRGPVDFKFSHGNAGKVLVEVKLTSNKQLAHGFKSQLPIYLKAEGAQRGIYLVINNGGASDGRLVAFQDLIAATDGPAPRVIRVDGTWRPSASVADH